VCVVVTLTLEDCVVCFTNTYCFTPKLYCVRIKSDRPRNKLLFDKIRDSLSEISNKTDDKYFVKLWVHLMFYGIQPGIKNIVVVVALMCHVQMYLWRCFCTFAGVLHAGGRSWLNSIE